MFSFTLLRPLSHPHLDSRLSELCSIPRAGSDGEGKSLSEAICLILHQKLHQWAVVKDSLLETERSATPDTAWIVSVVLGLVRHPRSVLGPSLRRKAATVPVRQRRDGDDKPCRKWL